MKKEALFAVCLTAATAAVLTGCATKQEAAAQRSQMEATELTVAEEQQMEESVCEETMPEVTPTTAETTPVVEPAPAPAKEEAAPVQEKPQVVRPQPVEYKVTSGDSVSALAVRFNVRKADILAMNPSLRGNPNNLRIGQTLMFPAGTDVTKKAQRRATSAAPANSPRPAGTTVYTVKSGDVLGGIAIKHGVTVAAIKEANNLKKDTIWVGQKLNIPGAKKTATKTAKKETKKAAPAPKAAPAKTEPAPIVTPVDAPVTPAPVVEEAPVVEPVETPVVEEELPPQNGEEAVLPPPPVVQGEAAQAPAQSDFVYVVREGEDIVTIATNFNVTPIALRALNGLETDVSQLPAGTTLRIPMPAAQ